VQWRNAVTAISVLTAVAGCAETNHRLNRVSSTVYGRSDSNATRVLSPAIEIEGRASNVSAQAGYTIDAWTGASVDVVTAATAAIRERRHEVTTGIGYEGRSFRLANRYRYSFEPDYWSHGLVLAGELDIAQKNTTLGLDLLGSLDTVGRARDPFFRQPLHSLGVRASVSQVLSRAAIAQLAWETTRLDGYQSSPYRFVAIGGDAMCAAGTPFCVSEQVPDHRLRNAVYARARYAVARTVSTGLEYRFYFDDWGVQSHAVAPDAAWRMSDATTLSVRCRYYTQSDARFYRSRYLDLTSSNGYVTRDRKLSAFYTNELGGELTRRFELADSATTIVVGARTTVSRFDYLAFVGLDAVWALELTGMFAVEAE